MSPTPCRLRRLKVRAAAAGLAGVMLWRLVPVCRHQLAAPFDLISEGPHLCTVQAIERGFDIYARESFLDLPTLISGFGHCLKCRAQQRLFLIEVGARALQVFLLRIGSEIGCLPKAQVALLLVEINHTLAASHDGRLIVG